MKTKKCKHCYKTKPIKKFPPTGSRGAKGQVFRMNVCSACRNYGKKQSRLKWKSRAYTAKTYKCIYDPGDWYTDTTWHKGTVESTAEEGNWIPGMWWLDQETNLAYQVRGNEKWYKVEVFLAEHPNSKDKNNLKKTSQRLVRARGKNQPPDGVLRRE